MFQRRMRIKKQDQTLIFSKSGGKKNITMTSFCALQNRCKQKNVLCKVRMIRSLFFQTFFFFQGTSPDLTITVTFVGIRWDTCLHHIPLPIWKKSARTIKIVDVSVGKRFSGVQTLTWVSDNPLDFDEYKVISAFALRFTFPAQLWSSRFLMFLSVFDFYVSSIL